ncbi:MAG: PQQ-like beta-propeller repeat protein [Verrucomicrobia bacterium]|nr:PQQ-like beta-propeller repeat protein [Verrucomicrobiota bacterium]
MRAKKLPLTALCVLCAVTSSALAANWPAWRGPLGTGIGDEKNLPVKWSATENVKWRVALPERGNSTPIVWNDRVFLTQPVGKERTLMCFNRSDGKLLWKQGVTTKLDDDPTHGTNPYCSASAVTDGERVIVWFGSDGLHCYDFAGRQLWSRDLGLQKHIWGYGSSPVIYGGLCFLNFGPGARSFLVAVDKKTGKTVWQRDEETGYGKPPPADVRAGKGGPATYVGSWTTPVIMRVEGRDQLLMSWPRRLAAYDPMGGKELWTCAGLNPLVYSSPIYSGDIIVTMGGFSGSSLAVRAGGSGDITSSRRLWHHPRTKQRIGSGVIHDGRIYIHNDPGVAECFDLKTGNLVWEERLRGDGKTGQNWSSVMLAGGNCYTITQGGDCFVFKASPKFELVAVNSLGERSNSSIVPSNGELLIRTHAALWCIGAKK